MAAFFQNDQPCAHGGESGPWAHTRLSLTNCSLKEAALIKQVTKCVHKIGEDLEKGNGATVCLMYMYNFYIECMHDKKYDTQTEWRVIKEEMRQCSVKVLEGLSIDPQNVHKCVIDSYENWYQGGIETANKMLHEDSQLIRKTGFRLHPAVTINGAIYKGNLKCPDVFEAICSAFKSKADQPDYCSHNSDLAITMRTKKEFIDDIMKDI